ncbi:MAG TPA: CHAT domain-containing protein [Phycisphaerales bacterium]|nr:CHAT domain-containing protein [Phycisphaerales bacterium]
MTKPSIQLDEVLGLEGDQRIERIRLMGDDRATMRCLIQQARARTFEDPEIGVGVTLRVVEIADALGDDVIGADARAAACHALSYANQTHRAIELGRSAIRLAERAGDEVSLANACLTAVQAHNLLGRREEALSLCLRASTVFQKVGDRVRSGTAEMLAGVVLRALDRAEQALERFDSAERLLAGDEVLLSQLASNRAEALLDLGRFVRARESFERALVGFERAGQNFSVAIVEGNLADLANRQGRLREALELFERARRHFEAADDSVEAARLDAEAAETLLAIGDAPEAQARLDRAVPVLDSGGMRSEHARALTALGVTLGRLGHTSRALSTLTQARALYESTGQPLEAARAFGLTGRVLLLDKDAVGAAEAIRSALTLTTDQPMMQARLKVDLAEAELRLGHEDEAERLLEEAGLQADSIGLADIDLEIESIHVQLFGQSGRYERALGSLRRAISIFEALRGSLPGDRLRASIVNRRGTLFEDGVGLGIQAGPQRGLVFEMAERAAARTLLDSGLTSADGRADPDPEAGEAGLGSHLAELRAEINVLLQSIEQAHKDRRPASTIASFRDRVRLAEREVVRLETRLSSRRAAAGFVSDPVSVVALAEALPERVGVFTLASSGDRLHGVLVTASGSELRPIAMGHAEASAIGAAVLMETDRALARRAAGAPISRRLTDRISVLLSSLGDGLLGSLTDVFDGIDRLAVVMPAGLMHLPLAPLRVGGRALVELCAPVSAPSATVAHALAVRQGHASARGVLAVGVSDEAIPSVRLELADLSRAFPLARVLRDGEATFDAFSRAVAEAGLIHIACHAEFSSEDAMGSRLRLADRWVSARQLARLRLEGATVVLGGCETGRSDARFAGEQFGMVRSLLIAGAKRTVANLWRLDDVASAELFSRLYEQIADAPGQPSDTIVQELAHVQRHFADHDMHPALWGGLVVAGAW